MLIDWFTVCAQALNFLILVGLLKRYLYKPVLAAIDAREKKIAGMISAAQAQEAKSRTAEGELRKRDQAFDRERDGLMQKAAQDAAAEHQRLIESAREDSQVLRASLTLSLAAERSELGRQLLLRTQAEVFALTRKALGELAGAGLEDRIIEVVIDRLRQMPEQERRALAVQPADPSPAESAAPAVLCRHVLVRSAQDPSPEGRTKLEAAIHEQVDANAVVQFATAPELIGGLEVSVEGVKLAWSVADYLSTLAQDAADLAAAELATAPSPPPQAPVSKVVAPKEPALAH